MYYSDVTDLIFCISYPDVSSRFERIRSSFVELVWDVQWFHIIYILLAWLIVIN